MLISLFMNEKELRAGKSLDEAVKISYSGQERCVLS
jgi:hypothetical protein